jgi:hypothetical protein
MDFLFVLLGVLSGLIYAFIGYAAQKDPFSWQKFLRTMIIAVLTTLGLDLTGITADVYTALVGPGAITVWLQKLIDTARGT